MASSCVTRNSDIAYQTDVLQDVSRTFALTIPQLPDALRDVVGNAYLLCRITDTIEDEPALSGAQKERFWRRLVDAVAGRGDAAGFAEELGGSLSSSTTASEHELVANTARVVRITHGFRPAQRRVLERCVRIMSRGMAEFQQRDTSAGLDDMAQVDSYCYHVAGVVGETLTELFCDYSAVIERRRDELLALAVSFGQGLQMINILKDIWEDRRRGACWLPRDIFLAAGFDLSSLCPGDNNPALADGLVAFVGRTRRHLEDALRFIEIVPRRETGIRRHCLWALGMAVLTLRRIHAKPTFSRGSEVKISRRSVSAVVVVTSILARSNIALRLLFEALTRSLPSQGRGAGRRSGGTAHSEQPRTAGRGLSDLPDEAAAHDAAVPPASSRGAHDDYSP